MTLAYGGYLLKFGSTTLPFKYMAAGTYKTTPAQMVDVDSYRDANAYLHRNVVRDDIVKIEWETPPLNNTEMQAMLAIIKGAMTNSMERKVTVTCYDDYNDTYQTGDFYVPDITFTPYRANATEILYMPTRIALIKY